MRRGAVLLTKLDEEMKTRSLGQDVLAGAVRPVAGLKVALEADILAGAGQCGLGGEVPDDCSPLADDHLPVVESLAPGQSTPGGFETVARSRLLARGTRS